MFGFLFLFNLYFNFIIYLKSNSSTYYNEIRCFNLLNSIFLIAFVFTDFQKNLQNKLKSIKLINHIK